MGVNSLPKTVTRQRRGCDLNLGLSAPESSTLYPLGDMTYKLNGTELTSTKLTQLHDASLVTRVSGITKLVGSRAASQHCTKFIVRSTYDSDFKRATIYLRDRIS